MHLPCSDLMGLCPTSVLGIQVQTSKRSHKLTERTMNSTALSWRRYQDAVILTAENVAQSQMGGWIPPPVNVVGFCDKESSYLLNLLMTESPLWIYPRNTQGSV